MVGFFDQHSGKKLAIEWIIEVENRKSDKLKSIQRSENYGNIIYPRTAGFPGIVQAEFSDQSLCLYILE